jgi:DNA (cytosine-5)-methyltransferase 1
MSAPKLLDLFCCQGGASRGYADAGFEVVGVDIDPQPHYPFEFHQADALKFLLEHHGEFSAFHASPPCQAHTNAQKIRGNEHPDYIQATRGAFVLIGKPWVIENVPGAPLHDPVELCGAMFGLETYRHRLFEIAPAKRGRFVAPSHPDHVVPTTKMGRVPVDGEYMHVVGNFSGVSKARAVMGMPWATRDGLREAIPPVYTEWIGRRLLPKPISVPDDIRTPYASASTPWWAEPLPALGGS